MNEEIKKKGERRDERRRFWDGSRRKTKVNIIERDEDAVSESENAVN